MGKFKKGDLVKVAKSNDNENYNKFKNIVLAITYVSNNREDHPGYDDSMKGESLYDLEVATTGQSIDCSLYEYELERYKK